MCAKRRIGTRKGILPPSNLKLTGFEYSMLALHQNLSVCEEDGVFQRFRGRFRPRHLLRNMCGNWDDSSARDHVSHLRVF